MDQRNRKAIRLLLSAALVCALVLLSGCGDQAKTEGRNSQLLPPDRTSYSVCFSTPDGDEVETVSGGSELKLETPAVREGYTFLGWMDEQGRIEAAESIAVFRDLRYTAVYAPALGENGHAAYLFPDQYGLFRAEDEMTRADAAIMLYSLLKDPPKGETAFIDVAQDADCYAAAASLKALGVINGSRFHPDEGITRAELLELLCAFYPRAKADHAFADLSEGDSRYALFCTAAERGWIESGVSVKAAPDEILTRLKTAQLMNRMLGRAGDRTASVEQIGVLPDLPPDDPAYAEMAEACVSHACELQDGAERWTESTPIKSLEEGLRLFGLKLYAVDADGHLVRGEAYQGFDFDEKGVYTSGNADLDALIAELFTQILDPSMEREDMLREAYRYDVKTFRYLTRNHYRYGDVSWVTDEAYSILSTKKGNCYGYAGAFCMMARALGYDAVCYNGFIGVDNNQHAWVEIEMDGVVYTFDPELEYANELDFKPTDMYKMDPKKAGDWHYIH